MTNVSILISDELKDISLLVRHLSIINTEGFEIELVLIQHKKLSKDDLEILDGLDHFHIKELLYPDDEDFLFRDVLENISGDYLVNYLVNLIYPADFLTNLFQDEKTGKDKAISDRAPYKIRLLKAVQQSKYGMGIVKQDIKRDYPEYRTSAAYKVADFTKLNFLELEIGENFASDLKKMAAKMSLKTMAYSPNYKSIQYFTDFSSYKKAIKKEAPSLSFKNKPNAIGLPLYLIIFILLSLFLSPFMITAVFPLLVVTAFYLLALTLESLAITTLKKQGDLFLGLMVLFPVIHFYYLWAWVSQLGKAR